MIKRQTICQELASCAGARNRCYISHNHADSLKEMQRWEAVIGRHEDRIHELLNQLPHGSGIDSEWEFDFEASGDNLLIFRNSFHAMEESGMYSHWIDFSCTVTPSFTGFDLKIRGRFSYRNRQDIAEYLHDTLYWGLGELAQPVYICDKCKEGFNSNQEFEYIFHQCDEVPNG